ncbi:MAG: histone H1 [Candidatus Rokubacteria bacterium]|nr:histone H1 [Candidatus Rokubacteria bacterium]
MAKRPPRPRDFAQRAKLIIDIATGQAPHDAPIPPESAKAAIGRKGGLTGGKARAKVLSPRKRTTIAKNAAHARWSKSNAQP